MLLSSLRADEPNCFVLLSGTAEADPQQGEEMLPHCTAPRSLKFSSITQCSTTQLSLGLHNPVRCMSLGFGGRVMPAGANGEVCHIQLCLAGKSAPGFGVAVLTRAVSPALMISCRTLNLGGFLKNMRVFIWRRRHSGETSSLSATP